MCDRTFSRPGCFHSRKNGSWHCLQPIASSRKPPLQHLSFGRRWRKCSVLSEIDLDPSFIVWYYMCLECEVLMLWKNHCPCYSLFHPPAEVPPIFPSLIGVIVGLIRCFNYFHLAISRHPPWWQASLRGISDSVANLLFLQWNATKLLLKITFQMCVAPQFWSGVGHWDGLQQHCFQCLDCQWRKETRSDWKLAVWAMWMIVIVLSWIRRLGRCRSLRWSW